VTWPGSLALGKISFPPSLNCVLFSRACPLPFGEQGQPRVPSAHLCVWLCYYPGCSTLSVSFGIKMGFMQGPLAFDFFKSHLLEVHDLNMECAVLSQ
jgi:hypothetical protein